ncbi:MAG: methylated-DNA--[protein]-cysteine S-methyltransferase [Kiritimatiellia bacterium]
MKPFNGRSTSLCYLERDGRYLVLHRTKKANDANQDKWIGVGGKFEPGETPDACALREVKEETGLTMTDFALRGLVIFVSDVWGFEYMYLYTATRWTGRLIACDEGELVWLDKAELLKKKLWEGDRLFLRALDERREFFIMKLRYEGERLVEVVDSKGFSDFRLRVYRELLAIPRGTTVSYGELARRLGCGSPQAVGQALRRNPFAPEIPCHRVVAADGSLGGYAGSRSRAALDRKRALLAAERNG